MWIDSLIKIRKNYIFYYFIIICPLLNVIFPNSLVNASHEFSAYRMNQYDLHGVSYGCRNSPISLEVQALNAWNSSRHCVIAKIEDMSKISFDTICKKAGALLIILPNNINELSENKKQHILSLEKHMIFTPEISIPIYFIEWDLQLQKILRDVEYNNISNTLNKQKLASKDLFNYISASSYQAIVSTNQATAQTNSKITTMHGKLTGSGPEEKLQTIALVAYYDSTGVAPELSFGAESNASGLTMLLELARVFSLLYSTGKSRSNYNLVFILSGAGKLNFIGSKKWLEDQFEGTEGSIVQDLSYVICLDSLSSSDNLFMHVSKPPKENSTGGILYQELKTAASGQGHAGIEGVHKKINLADEGLAWEHERYSIRRLPAATLSSLRNCDVPSRNTILDQYQDEKINILYKHTNILAEALIRQMYNISYSFTEPLNISKDYLSMWLNYLTSQPRSALLLGDKHDHLIETLKETLKNFFGDVKMTYYNSEKRDPEFLFYDVSKATLNVYRVKPAIFDLLLTLTIVAYLGILSLIINIFPHIYNFSRLSCR